MRQLFICLIMACITSLATAGELKITKVYGPDLPNKYKHPVSITELDNGDLFVAYYGGDGEYAADTAVYGGRLPKGSSTWTKPVELANTPHRTDGNGVVWQAPDGDVYLFYVVRFGDTWSSSRIKYKISHDGAKTWTDSRLLTLEEGMMVQGRPFVLSNGDYMLPAYCERGDDREIVGPESTSMFFRFNPKTKTWTESERIKSPNGNIQPAGAELKKDYVVAYCRRGGGYGPNEKGFIVRSESHDGGQTWSEGRNSEFPNPNAAMDFLKLQSGNLLMVYNDSMNSRVPLSVALSTDMDKSYPFRNVIMGAPHVDLGYPYAIQTRDGKIHVIFTERRTQIYHAVFDEDWVMKK
ncbi:hypothetical protein Mal52_07360 [Symmachiella dynata]|uniref:Sialidase domain-containing protein n=1 Tax=Symmachiella dynata TaxID=2527995 RepID=A0A517ZIH8_9PLAN|nr:sialidase family protein [Symmachiella dynata]QDU42280.1 hypothetical protein Mal52_07360 [Symmachiella dynata]